MFNNKRIAELEKQVKSLSEEINRYSPFLEYAKKQYDEHYKRKYKKALKIASSENMKITSIIGLDRSYQGEKLYLSRYKPLFETDFCYTAILDDFRFSCKDAKKLVELQEELQK